MTGSTIDLDAYLRRIGHDGPTAPTFSTLAALQAAHAAAIPFENLDVLLGRPIPLDAESLQDKLVRRGRGGYCYEQNSLFRLVLEALGFTVTALAARVVYRRPPGTVTPRTHLLLRVELPEGPLLADVGFGGPTPTVPLSFLAGIEQPTPLEPFRLLDRDGSRELQVRQDGEWQALYRFTLEPQHPVDLAMGNWFVSIHPESRFVNHLIVARSTASGRQGLIDLHYTLRDRERRVAARQLGDGAAAVRLIEQEFPLRLSAEDRPDLAERIDALLGTVET